MKQDPPTAPVSAVLFCFRQEDVVEAAIRSIFEQTVQPAEIILSDDASPDQSYQVIERIAAEYHGPATLRLRRTEGSSGWFAHINACMRMATCDHVVVFAGDDISKPDRIERFAKEIQSHPDAKLLWSMMERMHPEGRPTGKVMGVNRYVPGRLRGGVGASQCWHKDLIREFGDLPNVQAAEDIILPFRAWLLGGLQHIPEPLVLWRDRDYRSLSREQLDWTYEIRATQFRIHAAKVIRNDLDHFCNAHPDREAGLTPIRKRLERETLSVTAEHEVVSCTSRTRCLGLLVARSHALGFRRARRLMQDRVLQLPAYLDTAYPRLARRWLPRLGGVLAGGLVLAVPDWHLSIRALLAVIACAAGIELSRMLMRAAAKKRWKPA